MDYSHPTLLHLHHASVPLICHRISPNRRLETGPTSGRTMKRTRSTNEQIIGILAEHEAGAKCADLFRKHEMSEGTYYN